MILPRGPNLRKMILYVGPSLGLLFGFDLLIVAVYVWLDWKWVALPDLPLGTFGGLIGLIVGFRNTSSYQRWWEARTLWGSIVNYSRAFARQVNSLIDAPSDSDSGVLQEMRRRLIYYQIAWVHALRCHLRTQSPWDDLAGLIPEEELESLKQMKNVPVGIQERMAQALRLCHREGWMDTIRWASIDQVLTELVNAQGGAERIKNTPMPKQYDYFPFLFVHLYCVLLPLGMVANLGILTPIGSTLVGFVFLALDKIGRDLETPFDNTINDTPMTSISNTIEINLRQMLNETKLPEPEKPVAGVLW